MRRFGPYGKWYRMGSIWTSTTTVRWQILQMPYHHLKALEAYPEIAMVETPIPQDDVAGNRQIRRRFNRPLAMHYGSPPAITALKEDVTDGFVLCAGASRLLRQAAVCDEANKPFWLQLVGTGITTAWAAHLGAVLPQAKWPAITCMNIWDHALIEMPHDVRGGFYRVPEAPGLGVDVDAAALARYTVSHTIGWTRPDTSTDTPAPMVKSPTTPATDRTFTGSTWKTRSRFRNPARSWKS